MATRRPGEKNQTKAYICWRNIVMRCEDETCPAFKSYGGRGIRLCERWKSYPNFLEDMGDPGPGMTLDRIDNDKGYEPSNCRWVTRQEQSRNTSRNRKVTINGQTKCLKDWCEVMRLPSSTIFARVNLLGWPVEKALFTPIRKGRYGQKGSHSA